jgi:hypothetical protein
MLFNGPQKGCGGWSVSYADGHSYAESRSRTRDYMVVRSSARVFSSPRRMAIPMCVSRSTSGRAVCAFGMFGYMRERSHSFGRR